MACVTVVAVALFVSMFTFVYTLGVLVLTSPVTLENALPKPGLGTLICVSSASAGEGSRIKMVRLIVESGGVDGNMLSVLPPSVVFGRICVAIPPCDAVSNVPVVSLTVVVVVPDGLVETGGNVRSR